MNLTDAERHLMEHTTGWHHEQRMFRNHFVTNESTTDWPIIQGLIARGLMLMSRAPSQLSGGDPVFAVTAAGIEALKAPGQPEPTPETEPAPPPEEEQTGFDPFCPQCGSTEPDEDLCCDVCGVDMCHLADLRNLIAAHDAKQPAAPEASVCTVHGNVRHGGEAEELRGALETMIEEGGLTRGAIRRLLDRVDARDSLVCVERASSLEARLAAVANIVAQASGHEQRFTGQEDEPRGKLFACAVGFRRIRDLLRSLVSEQVTPNTETAPSGAGVLGSARTAAESAPDGEEAKHAAPMPRVVVRADGWYGIPQPAAPVACQVDTKARVSGCLCQWEVGDSPCPVHGEDEEPA